MGEDTLFVLPHELDFCSRLCGTAASPRERVLQTIWEAKACAIRDVHPGKRRKEALVAHRGTGLYLGESSADHFLQKSESTFVHPLIQGFRRYRNLCTQLRGFRGSLRQSGLGVTPAPKGDESQKEFARTFRRALDKTRATGRRFDMFSGKALCEHSEHAGRLFSHSSLLSPVYG